MTQNKLLGALSYIPYTINFPEFLFMDSSSPLHTNTIRQTKKLTVFTFGYNISYV